MNLRRFAVLGLGVTLGVAPAHAERFIEVASGVSTPTADYEWTDHVDPSVKLGVRAGSVVETGGIVTLDWTPINTDTDKMGFEYLSRVASHRFRIQLGLARHERVGKNVTASARVCAGLDITHVRTVTTHPYYGLRRGFSDMDVGLALEPALGLWFDLGSMQIGGEIALPVSHHGDGLDGELDPEPYTSIDLDLLFVMRFSSR
jgi:hypothetical protein